MLYFELPPAYSKISSIETTSMQNTHQYDQHKFIHVHGHVLSITDTIPIYKNKSNSNYMMILVYCVLPKFFMALVQMLILKMFTHVTYNYNYNSDKNKIL